MTEGARNFAVGLTVLVALALLGGMVLLFTGLPHYLHGGYPIVAQMPSTGGAREGDLVHFSGVVVGRVRRIELADPANPQAGVRLTVNVEDHIRLPGNTRLFVYRSDFGGSFLEFSATGEPMPHPQTGQPLDQIAPQVARDLVLEGRVRGGGPLDALAPLINDLREAAGDLGPTLESFARLADNLYRLLAPPETRDPQAPDGPDGPDPTAPPTAPAEPNLQQVLARLDRTLAGMENVLGDEQAQEDLKQTFANLAEASRQADLAMQAIVSVAEQTRAVAASAGQTTEQIGAAAQAARAQIDALSGELIGSAQQLSGLLATLNRAAGALADGEGTAGRILNDPELYEKLLATTEDLSKTLAEFRVLIENWRTGGVRIGL